MPLIDIACTACGKEYETHRPVSEWPKTPPCEDCGQPTKQVFNPPRTRWTVDPVVVFKAPDGSFRFPGDGNGLSARRYEQMGYHRVEIRGATEMRAFESKMNRAERARMERIVERRQAAREAREKVLRGELRHEMARMSEFGKAVARAAMQRGDARPRERTSDPGFHSEVYSNDRSNRDESRDAQGRRRRD